MALEVQAFGAAAFDVAADAAAVLNASYGLDGQFGRYASSIANPAVTSESQALALIAASRASVLAAVSALLMVVALRGDVPLAVQNLLDAVGAAMLSPADRIQGFLTLGRFAGTNQFALLCRRLSLIAMAGAARDYQPTSYDDAESVLWQVADALDVEITAAGDVGDDLSFVMLRDLRVAVAEDLTARGATLAPLAERKFATNLPAIVMAQVLYGTAERADELVRRVDPIHPLFMPVDVLVLAS
jgi:prophage DNA circulation protein